MCCQYGTDGNKIATAGYDCLQIPGAAKAAAPSTAVAPKLCGTKMGLVTAAGVLRKIRWNVGSNAKRIL